MFCGCIFFFLITVNKIKNVNKKVFTKKCTCLLSHFEKITAIKKDKYLNKKIQMSPRPSAEDIRRASKTKEPSWSNAHTQ